MKSAINVFIWMTMLATLTLSCGGGGGGGSSNDDDSSGGDDTSNDDDIADDDDTPVNQVDKSFEIRGIGRFLWTEPENAPIEGVSLTVAETPDPAIWDAESGWLAIGPTLEATPAGQLFNPPAQLEYVMDSKAVNALGDLVGFGLVRGITDEGAAELTGMWISKGIYQAEVEHFSSFSLGIPASVLTGEAELELRRLAQQGLAWANQAVSDLFCGNGIVEDPEACDGAPTLCDAGCYQGTLLCDDRCRLSEVCDLAGQVCGNGLVEGCEVCDEGAENGGPERCRIDCMGTAGPVCGNGVVESGEACDEGAENGQPNRCATNCQRMTPPFCGNGVIEGGESCDDGVDNGRIGYCDAFCGGTAQAFCGNGVVEGAEACDLGSRACLTPQSYAGQQLCNVDCAGYGDCFTSEFCGDGAVNGDEICDSTQLACQPPGGSDGSQSCKSDCSDYGACQSNEFCGDGVVSGSEFCDQGSLNGSGLGVCRGDCSSYCEYPIEVIGLNDPAYGLDVFGDFAYVAASRQGLAVVDIHIPGFPGIPDFANVNGIAVGVGYHQSYVYVANEFEIAAVDVSSPINPKKTTGFGCCGTPDLTDVARVVGDRLWISNNINEFSIFNIAQPGTPPTLVGSFSAYWFNDVVATGGLAYTAQNVSISPTDNKGRLVLYDLTNPNSPSPLGDVEFNVGAGYNIANAVAVLGSYAYVVLEKGDVLGTPTSGTLAAVNISNPSSLGVPLLVNTPLAFAIDIQGDRAYLAVGAEGIAIYDLSNPAAPLHLETIPMNGFAYDVKTYLGRAFVANGGAGLGVLHLNPSCEAKPGFLP